MRAQACTGSRRIGLDGITLIKQVLVIKLLQEPPKRLYVTVVIGDVWIIKVHPVTHLVSKVGPFLGKFHHILAAGCVIVGHRDGLSDVLLGDTECLLHSEFYGKAMGIPAGLASYQESLHCLVTAEGVLDGTGHYVVDAGHAVG